MALDIAATPETDPARDLAGLDVVAEGVSRLTVVFVNVYAVEAPFGGWVLVDTGLPGTGGWLRKKLESRFGSGNPPSAIILTHGHFDHSGGASTLADAWDVPVYAHSLELPYLTRRSDYAPADPTPGGAICFLSRFFPGSGCDVSRQVRALPASGIVPGLPDWRWIHTPGHTPGHVSLFRNKDRTLLAGDALTTTDLDSWTSEMTWARSFNRPPTPLTPDWTAARQSVWELAELEPRTVAAGHGLAISGSDVPRHLRSFATSMHPPAGARYSHQPARYRPDGSLASVPPPVADPLPGRLLLGAGAVLLGWSALRMLKSRR